MLTLPQNLERLILYNLGLQGVYDKEERLFAKRIRELREILRQVSDYFIRERMLLKEKVFQSALEDGYLAFFSPLSFVKTWTVFNELMDLYPELSEKPIRLIDIGAGQCAGALGVVEVLNRRAGKDPIEIVCVDRRNPKFNLLEELNIAHKYFNIDIEDVRIRKTKGFNLALIINSLTEAYGFNTENPFRKLMLIVDQILEEDGILMIVEPAMKDSTRVLMGIRDRISKERKDIHIISPCVGIKECPLLKVKSRTEWCHFGIHWETPVYMRILNRELKREIHFAKFSYMVLSKKEISLPEWYIRNMRVVSNLIHEKGKKRFYTCYQERYVEFERLDRDASQKNKDMESLNKGDIVEVEETSCIYKGGRLRIQKETKVRILRPMCFV